MRMQIKRTLSFPGTKCISYKITNKYRTSRGENQLQRKQADALTRDSGERAVTVKLNGGGKRRRILREDRRVLRKRANSSREEQGTVRTFSSGSILPTFEKVSESCVIEFLMAQQSDKGPPESRRTKSLDSLFICSRDLSV